MTRRARKPKAEILTIAEWDEMRRANSAPARMRPYAGRIPAKVLANLPANVVRFVPRPRLDVSHTWVLAMGDQSA